MKLAVGYDQQFLSSLQSIKSSVRHYVSCMVRDDAAATFEPSTRKLKNATRRQIFGTDITLPYTLVAAAPYNGLAKSPATQSSAAASGAQRRAAKRTIASEPPKTDETCAAALAKLEEPFDP